MWGWLARHPARALALTVAAVVVLQLPFVTVPLGNDEGGFLYVADQWGPTSDQVYGSQWVDRPPLLLLAFKVISALGGSTIAVRLAATLFAALTVAAAWWAGRAINGGRGAAVAAVVTASINASFWLGGYQLTGERIGGAFVMVSCALALAACRDDRARRTAVVLALGAGFTAACAVLVKQSFVDAALFGTALFLLHRPALWRLLAAGTAGALAPLAGTAAWAASRWGPGLGELWNALFTFREQAAEVLATSGTTATEQRLHELIALVTLTGIVVVVVGFVVEALQLREQWRLSVAIAVTLLYAVMAVAGGGSYWPHYLLGVAPALALAAAFASLAPRPRVAATTVAGVVALSSVLAACAGVQDLRDDRVPNQDDQVIGDWLGDAARPDDTVFVAYGSPSIIHNAGLGSTYPYSWSLPIRVRDPDLTELTALLKSPAAPTWIVEVGDFDWWGLDTPEFEQLRRLRYVDVGSICGHEVLLLLDAMRELPPLPACT